MTLENLLAKLRAEVAKGKPKFDEHDSLFDTGVAAGRYELAEELLTRFDAPPLELKPSDWYVDTDDYQAITEVDSSGIRRHYIDGGFLALNVDAGWPSRRMTPEEIQAFKTDGTFPTNNDAVDMVLTALDCGDRLDDVFVERASETLHVEWLKRNTWVKPGSEEAKPYGELTETSKNKDRLFVRHAMKAVERFATVEYQEAREAHYAEQARDALDRGKSPAERTDAEFEAAIKRRGGGTA